MSAAAWLMVRFQAERAPEDLDQAIAVWTGLMETDAGALAAANLGRALLARHALSGDPEDLHDGRELLGMASVGMRRPSGAADVELALKAARLTVPDLDWLVETRCCARRRSPRRPPRASGPTWPPGRTADHRRRPSPRAGSSRRASTR